MSERKYPRIEDILEELTEELNQRGFSRIASEKEEIVRYARRESSIEFQVGIEEDDSNEEEPEDNHVYLKIGCKVPPENCFGDGVSKLFPVQFMYYFFRNTSQVDGGLCGNEDVIKEGKVNLIYHVAFEKEKAKRGEMKAVLREAITYVAEYMTVNMEMLERTRTLRT